MKLDRNIYEVSVVIPTYNVSKYIESTLESVIMQTIDDFEIVIVDDGSTDNTVELCKKTLETVNIPYKILRQSNSGVSVARNRGIDASEGKYIYLLDSDDLINKFFLEKMIYTAKKNNADIVFCGFDKIDEQQNLIEQYSSLYSYIEGELTGIEVLKLMLKEQIWICTISGIYKRELICNNNITYTPKCSNGEDQEFCMKNLIHAKNITCVKESLAFYVQRDSSVSYSGSLKKFNALGATRRVINYAEKESDDKNIVQYLKYNKYQKEFFRNFNSLLKYSPNSEVIKVINRNKKFINQLKKYKSIEKSKKEMKFSIRYRIYVYAPNLYTCILKKIYNR
ncbi:glycosyltransferase family 2 protein [Paraclostridium bifermentans]|uniref:Glycosyltransferase n=1 Tax=Paraclostridium bifermentans TaxID=1490 RepID=A0A5P3XHL5_PARBF|nr:glycosyltransferase [Paraclostridium bifermentans]QEZ69850.1 glycosyltransferase [Paraclostridium bifermentans]